MNFKLLLIGAAAAMAVGSVHADTLDLTQFLPEGVTYGTPLDGVTSSGVDYSIVSPNAGFLSRVQRSGSWPGIFIPGAAVLFDMFGSGPVTATFATPITSLSEYLQSNLSGTFNETATAYDGVTQVDSVTIDGLQSGNLPGTAKLLTVSAAAITSVVFSTTNDVAGFGISDPPVPEPATWALMLIGFAGLGFAGYRTSRNNAATAA
jgi:hypothetical protein